MRIERMIAWTVVRIGDGRRWRQTRAAARAERSGRAQVARLLAPCSIRRRGGAVLRRRACSPTGRGSSGPALARRCQPVRIDYAPGRRSGGTLLLQAAGGGDGDPARRPQILERINTYFGFRAVRQLRLLQMPLPPAAAPPPPRRRPLRAEEEAALAAGGRRRRRRRLREALLALGRAVAGSRR